MSNAILLDIPESFETERLIIRVPRPGDGPALNEAVLETFESLHAWMPWAKERPTIELSEETSRSPMTDEDWKARLARVSTSPGGGE